MSIGAVKWKASLSSISSLVIGLQLGVCRFADVRYALDWDSVQAYKDFIADAASKPFLETFSSLLDGDALIYHTHFSPSPPSSVLAGASSPAAEHLTFYFPSPLSDIDRSSWDDTFASFKKTVQHAEGFKAGAEGWVVEELQHESVEGNSIAYTAVFEWESIEKHTAFRNTDQFKEAIEPLRDASKGRQMHHVKFQEG